MAQLGRTIHGTAEGDTIKHVACQNCQTEYVYHMRRKGHGSGYSFLFLDDAGAERRANAAAEDALQKKLTQECDAVPCPNCGWYQRDMVAKLRKEYASWMNWVGGLSLLFAVFAFVAVSVNESARRPNPTFRMVAVGLLVTLTASGVMLPLLRLFRKWFYDPNATPPADRIALGLEKAMPRTQFEQAAAQAAQEASEELAAESDEDRFEIITDSEAKSRGFQVEPRKPTGSGWANYAFAVLAVLAIIGKFAAKWNRANRNNNQPPPPAAPAFRP